MPKAVKVAVSMPSWILDIVEQERKKRGESRSEFFRQAVQSFVRGLKEREDVERYVRGYLEQPETGDEIEAIRAAGAIALAGEPWD